MNCITNKPSHRNAVGNIQAALHPSGCTLREGGSFIAFTISFQEGMISIVFVHLHVHSPFSFLDGASTIHSLVTKAAEMGMPALAITDHHNLSGAVKFQKACRQAGIKPLLGAEVTTEGGYHLVLLAQNPSGYANLCRLLTRAHLDHPRGKPMVTIASLCRYREHLVAMSGCRRGEIPSLIMQRRYQSARRAAETYRSIFGRNFYLELSPPSLPGDLYLNRRLAELGETLAIPLVVTNNVHFTSRQEFPYHDLLTCVRTLSRLDEAHPERRLNGENFLKSPAEMAKGLADYPQALANTLAVAEKCVAALPEGQPLHPRFPLPPGVTPTGYLYRLVMEGASQRYTSLNPAVKARLEHELHIINTLGFTDYFLLVWDVARHAREQRIRYAGRGSAADSAVAYCLYITDVDPIARRLLFERFMSLERAEKPDIDIDFDARYRDRMAAYLYKKYGEDCVASVATYNTYQARGAVRDMGKAMGLPGDIIGRLAKLLPSHLHADRIEHMMACLPELQTNPLPPGRDYRMLLQACAALAGFPRFLGTHLGGLVVAGKPLATITPLQMAAKGVVVTQFDKDDVEDLGLIKLDLLSLRTMSAVDDAVETICLRNPGFNYDSIPENDPDTFALLSSGHTIGVFQLESPAQRALQARLGASDMEDVIASLGLIRPGPIKGNMVEPYIARRHGKEPISYIHPLLEPILAKTYGVVLFQEQVIEIATVIAGFTPGEADRLRRVMTSARSHREMAEIGEHFIQKAIGRGIPPDIAATVFSYIQSYASYGFCEAHAAAFAGTAYKTAYLLAHHPAEYYAALLSHQPMGYYPPNTLAMEARRRGIPLLPPDVNRSGRDFVVEGRGIRTSLTQIKGLSQSSLRSILAARSERPFSSLADLYHRTIASRDELENLIRCGALDNLNSNRRELLWQLGYLCHGEKKRLTGVRDSAEPFWDCPPEFGRTPVPDFTPAQKRAEEYHLLGLDLHQHLAGRLRPWLDRRKYLSSREVAALPDGAPAKTAGTVLRPHRPPTRSGRVVVFLSLEDEFGLVDVTVFENIYHRYGRFIFDRQSPLLGVKGIVSRRGKGVSLLARQIWPVQG